MKEVEINKLVFIVIGLLYTYWYLLIRKNKDLRSVYVFHYLFNFLLFVGPLIYYKLGFTGYSSSITEYALNIFYYINIAVVILNIIIYQYCKKTNQQLFHSFLKKITFAELKHKKTVTFFYWSTILIVSLYVYTYRSYFPLMQLFYFGELGERLDATGAIPLYITFASFSFVFIPSAFFYLKNRHKTFFVTIPLFIFTIFCLSMGGNKGLVSFFLMFYALISAKKAIMQQSIWVKFKSTIRNLLVGIILVLCLTLIYAIFKGKTELNDDTILYLMESPFRRLFAAQGVGYIVRIELLKEGAFNHMYSVKEIVYSYIYNEPIGSGSAPTHFTGTLLIQIGYIPTLVVFIIYTFYATKILNTLSLLHTSQEDSFVTWNFFVLTYALTNSDLTLSIFILLFFIIVNLIIIRFTSRLKLS